MRTGNVATIQLLILVLGLSGCQDSGVQQAPGGECDGDLLLLSSGGAEDCSLYGGYCAVDSSWEAKCLPLEGGGSLNTTGSPRFLSLPLASNARVVNGWYYNFAGNGAGLLHHAVDFEAAVGTPIYAACDGVAMTSSQYSGGRGYGRFIQIRCDETSPAGAHYHLIYGHVSEAEDDIASYPSGLRRNTEYDQWTRVSRNQMVGASGSEDTSWPHLHFEVQLGYYCGTPVDPYDIYATTTSASMSAEQEYPPAGSRYTACGPYNLWRTCPPEPATPAEVCPAGDGLYCGEAVALDAGTLYRCTGGNYVVEQVCAQGCEVQPTGQDDRCADTTPDCVATCDWRTCGSYGGCNCGTCSSPSTCQSYQCVAPDPVIEASPSTGWTPTFTQPENCSCSASSTDCYTLYLGRVDSLVGNQASLSFQKTGGGAPSANVHYWVVVGGDTYPSCLDRDAYVTRTEGTWYSSQTILSVTGIDVWPSQAAFDSAPCGDTKKLFLITGGGGGHENERLWFQKQAIVFTKVCE